MTELAVAAVPQWSLGDRLRKARETAGLEQGELAVRVGVSRGTVSNYELNHGTRPRKPIVLRAWAEQTGVPLWWIMGGEETSRPDRPAVGASAAGNLLAAGARSSTDRASDYGSGLGRIAPFRLPSQLPLRRDRRRRSRHVVPLTLVADRDAS
ncbi:MAG: helix-turn-helix transcriptional regulator [Nonomuraea sp.]|nr:helix-turn-helix transcriptional regulator [Nonomuraea sp.]